MRDRKKSNERVERKTGDNAKKVERLKDSRKKEVKSSGSLSFNYDEEEEID